MSLLQKGDKMPNFTFNTSTRDNLNIQDEVNKVSGKTAVVFLRYLGCTACQFDIIQYAKNYQKIKDIDCQMFVVLQSPAERVNNETEEFKLPFEIICDPDQVLYKSLELPVAKDKDELHDFGSKAWEEKTAIIKASGLTHGEYEGEELQLPATFIIDHELNILDVHYGKFSSDNYDTDQLVEIMK